jgi:hypothetical protein
VGTLIGFKNQCVGLKMPHPTVDEFKSIIVNDPLETIARSYILEGVPYVFRERPETMNILRTHLHNELGASKDNIIVVGSGKIGFSLNPDTFPRLFSDDSDIDVVVVDGCLFDTVWFTMLRWHYPRRGTNLGGVDAPWARERRRELYWGWFVPSDIRYEGLSFPNALKPLRDISTKWFNAFRSLSQYPELTSRNVSGRLYRTWDHALLYHTEGLRLVKKTVEEAAKGVTGDAL